MGRMHHIAGDARCCRTMLRMTSGVQRFGTSLCIQLKCCNSAGVHELLQCWDRSCCTWLILVACWV